MIAGDFIACGLRSGHVADAAGDGRDIATIAFLNVFFLDLAKG
jgi:hypothetical protein